MSEKTKLITSEDVPKPDSANFEPAKVESTPHSPEKKKRFEKVRKFIGHISLRVGKEPFVELDAGNLEPLEPMKGSYDRRKNTERFSHDRTRVLAEGFWADLEYGPKDSGMFENAYSIVRNIGDLELSDGGANGVIHDLIEVTRWQSRPRKFIVEQGAGLGSHSGSERVMRTDYEEVLKHASHLEDAMDKAGAPEKKQDAKLLSMLYVASHEAGHAMLNGFGAGLKDSGNTHSIDFGHRKQATAAYLASHPSEAFVGDINIDVRTHEERFAEGYSWLVLSEVMSSLGYAEGLQQEVLLELGDKTSIMSGAEGQSIIDYIDTYADNRDLVEKGQLGYSAPLSPQQLREQILFYRRLMTGESNAATFDSISDSEWSERVHTSRDIDTSAVVAQQDIRAASIKAIEAQGAHERPHKPRARRRAKRTARKAARQRSAAASSLTKPHINDPGGQKARRSRARI